MVKCYYDLHIHSALSPCGHEDMTLHNIVNMATLKELDIIAITDHNSAKNVETLMEIASEKELLIIPGIEVETYEGIHMLCYLRTIEDLKLFDKLIYRNIPNIENNEDLCGQQIIYNIDDEVKGKEGRMLMNSTNLKLIEVINLVRLFNGLIFAAHIDRYANSIMTVLGFIPENLDIDGIEISLNKSIEYYKNDTSFKKYRIIQNSDAHYLGNICEKINYLELPKKSIDAFFDYLGGEI